MKDVLIDENIWNCK